MNFEACHKTLPAMGDEMRQHIILEMMRMDYNGSRVPDITGRTNLSRPAVSHHLQILKDAGIVKMRKEGTMTYYYLDPDMESFTLLSNALLQAVQICAALPNRSGEEYHLNFSLMIDDIGGPVTERLIEELEDCLSWSDLETAKARKEQLHKAADVPPGWFYMSDWVSAE